jgi:hypothetical protein
MQQIAIILDQNNAADHINAVLKSQSQAGFLLTSIVTFGLLENKFILTFVGVTNDSQPQIKID